MSITHWLSPQWIGNKEKKNNLLNVNATYSWYLFQNGIDRANVASFIIHTDCHMLRPVETQKKKKKKKLRLQSPSFQIMLLWLDNIFVHCYQTVILKHSKTYSNVDDVKYKMRLKI